MGNSAAWYDNSERRWSYAACDVEGDGVYLIFAHYSGVGYAALHQVDFLVGHGILFTAVCGWIFDDRALRKGVAAFSGAVLLTGFIVLVSTPVGSVVFSSAYLGEFGLAFAAVLFYACLGFSFTALRSPFCRIWRQSVFISLGYSRHYTPARRPAACADTVNCSSGELVIVLALGRSVATAKESGQPKDGLGRGETSRPQQLDWLLLCHK